MFRNRHNRSAVGLELLRDLPMFKGFSDDELATVDSMVDEVFLPQGAHLTVEGQPGREAFIVLEGEVEVRRGDVVLGRAGHGAVIGEMALLEQRPRTATVTALTALHVLVVDPRNFRELLADARTARWVAEELSQRLRDAEAQLGSPA